MFQQPGRAQTRWVAALDDRAGDLRGEIGKAHDPSIVGPVQLLALGELAEFAAPALPQPRFEQMRADDQLDQAWVRLCRSGIGPVDAHLDLFAGPAELRWDRQGQNWLWLRRRLRRHAENRRQPL